MTTRLRESDLGVEPIREFTAYPPDSADGWGSLEEAKKSAFARGDLVAMIERGRPTKALVLRVAREFSAHSGQWIQRYRVRPYRVDGTPGGVFRWVSPGDIERGFEAMARERDRAETAGSQHGREVEDAVSPEPAKRSGRDRMKAAAIELLRLHRHAGSLASEDADPTPADMREVMQSAERALRALGFMHEADRQRKGIAGRKGEAGHDEGP